MIIDCDTHISPVPEGGIGITSEEMIERMDKAGVDKCFTWPYYPYQRERLTEYCKYIYKSVQAYPDRLLGFGWIDPSLGLDKAVELTRTCMEEYGLRGVKLNGSQNLFRYDDLKTVCPIVDVVAKAGGVVTMHTGADCPSRTHPYYAVTLAKHYPETTFMLVHMGGVTYPDLSDCAIEAAQQAANIQLIGSHIGMVSVLKAVNKLGADRVCFGSDTPFNLMHVELAAYKALLNDQPTQNTAKVLGENAARIMNI